MNAAERLEGIVRNRAGESIERTEQRVRELAERSDDVVWMFTGDWSEAVFVDVGDRLPCGRSADVPRERSELLDRVHPEDRERVSRTMARLSNGHATDVEYRVEGDGDCNGDGDGDGSRWLRSHGEPITEDGSVVRIAGVTRDVTERKLRQRNERLDEFARTVSHDLRSPLNVAQGRLELARRECESDHLDDIEAAHGRIAALIEDLLRLARQGEQVGETEPVAVAEAVDECWQVVEREAATLSNGTDLVVRADRSRLKQLLTNLLRNAVEHGGRDVVVMTGDLPDGFYVEDDGPGVPESERESVFDPGYSTSSDGTGLGLRIVEQVADAHGWRIRVTEGSFGGARFEVSGVDANP
jgi:signal transduction histidine kinase